MTMAHERGMMSLVAFMRPRILGMWPRGGTWSASVVWWVNRHTHAVVTVSRISPYTQEEEEEENSTLVI